MLPSCPSLRHSLRRFLLFIWIFLGLTEVTKSRTRNQSSNVGMPAPEGMGPAALSKLGAPWWRGCLPLQTGGSLRLGHACHRRRGSASHLRTRPPSSVPHPRTRPGTKQACGIAGVRGRWKGHCQRERKPSHPRKCNQRAGLSPQRLQSAEGCPVGSWHALASSVFTA